jgi:hypothetical protein
MSSSVLIFQQARTILCLCPCCGDIVRLADLRLRYEGVTPETWLDKYERSLSRFERQLERFKASEGEIRKQERKAEGRHENELSKSSIQHCQGVSITHKTSRLFSILSTTWYSAE